MRPVDDHAHEPTGLRCPCGGELHVVGRTTMLTCAACGEPRWAVPA